MRPAFAGFSPQAISFLKQLEKNNTREWFQPRKASFDRLLREPMLELADRVLEPMRTYAVDHVCEPKKAVHRIYRDTRFSKDKTPYKTNISMMFPIRGLSKLAGGMFYFSLSAHHLDIAGGVYLPGPPELAALRRAIDADPLTFGRTLNSSTLTRLLGPLRGDSSARPPKGYPADHPAIDLLRRKQFYYARELPTELATAVRLDKLLTRHFKAMAPAVHYLNDILLRDAAGEDDDTDSAPRRPAPMF